jgi:hypothetical protein
MWESGEAAKVPEGHDRKSEEETDGMFDLCEDEDGETMRINVLRMR